MRNTFCTFFALFCIAPISEALAEEVPYSDGFRTTEETELLTHRANATLASVGTCDSNRSSVMIYYGTTFRMMIKINVDPDTAYYAILMDDDTAEQALFFTRQYREVGRPVVEKLHGKAFAVRLRGVNERIYRYIFGDRRGNGCRFGSVSRRGGFRVSGLISASPR